MKKILVGSLPFLCMFLILTFISKAKPSQTIREHTVTIQQGLLTLPAHTDEDIFSLQGQWHFTPNQFYSFNNVNKPQYAPLPGKLRDSPLHTDYGYASYGLRIVGLDPNKIYAIQINHLLSSCTIAINGFDRAGQGQPGVSESTEIPGKTVSIATFKPRKNGTADIVINMSNFHNRYGGTDQSILLGAAEVLNTSFVFSLLFYNIACTIILVFSLFFIVLHLNYQKMPYILWFAFTAIIISIRISVFYPHIATYVWPSIPWKLFFILRYTNIPLSVLFFTVFIKKIFNISHRLFYRGIITLCGIATLFTIFASTAFVSRYLHIQQAIIIIAAIYNAGVIVWAFIQKNKYALWIGAVLCLLAGFAIHDTLVSQWIISGKLLLQEGAVIAILIAVVMSINGYAASIHQIEYLVEEQKQIQNALRRFFPNQLLTFLKKKDITEISTGDASELSVTVLSIDIRSFTSLSEQLTPDEVFLLLNKYFALVAPIIRHFNGVIMKFLGDGFIALFPDAPDSALQCGITIQRKLQEEKLQLHDLPPLRAGIGIDTGAILLGVIGNDTRLDSMVISNTCYTAEDLQAATKIYSNTIIISETILQSLENPATFHIRRINEAAANDKLENTILYEVYDCDTLDIQEKKQASEPYIEQALKKLKEKRYAAAYEHFEKALKIYPDDPLVLHYQALLKAFV